MSQESSDNKERSVSENIIIVLLLGMLMASFIHYFFKQEDRLTHVGLSSLANAFSLKVLAVRSQWFMDNKPNSVLITERSSEYAVKQQQLIPVNNNGWLDVSDSDNACNRIWFYAIGTTTDFMKETVVAMEVKNNKALTDNNLPPSFCRYSMKSGWYFDYYRKIGKVTPVAKLVI